MLFNIRRVAFRKNKKTGLSGANPVQPQKNSFPGRDDPKKTQKIQPPPSASSKNFKKGGRGAAGRGLGVCMHQQGRSLPFRRSFIPAGGVNFFFAPTPVFGFGAFVQPVGQNLNFPDFSGAGFSMVPARWG